MGEETPKEILETRIEELEEAKSSLEREIEEQKLVASDNPIGILNKTFNYIMSVARFTTGRADLLRKMGLSKLESLLLADINSDTNVVGLNIQKWYIVIKSEELKIIENKNLGELLSTKDRAYTIYESRIKTSDLLALKMYAMISRSPHFENTLREWHSKLEGIMGEMLKAVTEMIVQYYESQQQQEQPYSRFRKTPHGDNRDLDRRNEKHEANRLG